jgi:hypothetical protein
MKTVYAVINGLGLFSVLISVIAFDYFFFKSLMKNVKDNALLMLFWGVMGVVGTCIALCFGYAILVNTFDLLEIPYAI